MTCRLSVEWRTKPHGVPLLPCAHSTRRPLRTFGSHEVAVALRSSAERHAVAGREGEDLQVACGGALMWSVECHCRSQMVEMCSEAGPSPEFGGPCVKPKWRPAAMA